MCSSRSANQATTAAKESLVRNVTIRGGENRYESVGGGSRGSSYAAVVEEEKKKTAKFVDVEDRGQFQYTDTSSGDIVRTPDIQKQLDAKTATLNVSRAYDNTGRVDSYSVPAILRIKRNWSVKGPGGLSIPSMNTDLATRFTRTDQSARKPDVRIVNGKIKFG